jgi:apolipoprotein N-acyltransferase
MDSSANRSVVWSGAAATILSGAAWWFGTGLHPQAWLTWLAPLPLLLLAPRMRWQYAALAALGAGACAGLNLWHYLIDVIGLPLPVGVLAALAPAVTFALSLLLFRRLWLLRRYVAAAVAFPALWVAVDYLSFRGSPHGTFGSLAYSQLDVLPFVQVASLAGIWGVSFFLLLAPATLTIGLMPGPDRRQRLLVAGAAYLLLAAVFAFGFARLLVPATGSTRIGLASMPGKLRPAVESAEGQAMLGRYLAAIDTLAAQGAQIVVLPETVLATDKATMPEFAASAARNKVTITTGVALKKGAQGQRNSALAFVPGAAAPAGYAKHHLIPGFEDHYQPGTDYAMLPGTRTGLAVCKDMDFHDTGRAYSDRGANLLLVPAWDFAVDGRMHSRMAVMRGIESGFAVARAALRGNLTLSDNRGRIVAETSDALGDATLIAEVALHDSRTFYARWGDWFAWLNLAMLVGALLRLRSKRESAPQAS